jgi:hypothetical protein
MINKLGLTSYCHTDVPLRYTWNSRGTQFYYSKDLTENIYKISKVWKTFLNIE